VLPTDRDETVGWLNVQHALARLQQERIPVAARRTGGLHGQQIRFHTATSDVFIKTIQSSYL
jgi:chemotaxis receptor (MCP) glutamine deamidase CheD